MAEQKTRQAASQLRQLGAADLQKQVAQARQQLWNLHAKRRTGSLQQPHEFRAVRRQVARLLTVLNEQAASARQERRTA